MIGRCRHRSDFDALRSGRRLGARVLWVRVALDREVECSRVAFAIGRRTGNAVERNLLRRRIQSVLRQLEADLPPGRYLFGSHRPASKVTYTDVVTDVYALVERTRALSHS